MLRIPYLIAIAVVFTLLCNSADFHRSISSSPTRLNPLLATDSASGAISGWIFTGLLKFDKNGKIVPDMAESYRFEDNTTLVFKLKKGIKWHDGKEFDAYDVLFTWKWLRSESVVTPYKSDFKYVKSIETPDRYTLRIEYSRPYFKALSIWMMGILPEHLWKDVSDPMRSDLNRLPVGTGPYRLEKAFGINERIILHANEKYYEHPPFIGRQIFHYIGDPSAEFMMLESGKLDIGSLSPLQVSRQIDDDFKKRFDIYERPSQGYTYLGFNLRKRPFDDPRIRKAIAYAIDKKELIDLLFFSHGVPCHGPFMPGSDTYPNDYEPHGYDPEEAKKLLSQAGYGREKPLSFTLVTNTGNDIRIGAAQIIQQQLARVGIDMKIRTMEWQAFLNTVVFPHRFDAVLLGWSLSLIPDAYPIWHSDSDKTGGFNFIGYHNEKVDKLIERSESMTDRERFASVYREIFRLIVEDHPYVFLYIPNSITAISKKIKGVEPSTILGIEHNFIDWRIED
jgi:peptide/nickel transport system substrate-binding protein